MAHMLPCCGADCRRLWSTEAWSARVVTWSATACTSASGGVGCVWACSPPVMVWRVQPLSSWGNDMSVYMVVANKHTPGLISCYSRISSEENQEPELKQGRPAQALWYSYEPFSKRPTSFPEKLELGLPNWLLSHSSRGPALGYRSPTILRRRVAGGLRFSGVPSQCH